MSENIIDPLDMPPGECKEPSFPIFKEGIKRMVIKSLEYKKSEDQKSEMASVRLNTTQEDKSTEGLSMPPGMGFFQTIFLTPNDRNSPESIRDNFAMLIKAALGTAEASKRTPDGKGVYSVTAFKNNSQFFDSAVKDKVVDVKVGIKRAKADSQYGDQNIVKAWIVPS